MGNRRKAREFALKILYQKEITKSRVEESLANFWSYNKCDEETKRFSERLVLGVDENQEEIDQLLKKYSKNWVLDRIGTVEKNIIRFAAYELTKMDDIPPGVTINEAVDIAKKFGTKKTSNYVNAILDNMLKKTIKV